MAAPFGLPCPMQRAVWVVGIYYNKNSMIVINSESVSRVVMGRHSDEPGGLVFHNDTLYIANNNAHEIMCLNPNNGHAEALNAAEELVEI